MVPLCMAPGLKAIVQVSGYYLYRSIYPECCCIPLFIQTADPPVVSIPPGSVCFTPAVCLYPE